jgi:hypothetical protein
MSRRWVARLAVMTVAIIVVSLGSSMTAAIKVPATNAGVMSVPVNLSCSVPVSVTFLPSNLNRVSASHTLVTATLTFSGGIPAGATVTNVLMQLPGGSQPIDPLPGGGPDVFEFTRDSVLSLVGPQNGDLILEVTGIVGQCPFSAQNTIKVSGPIS